MTKIFTRAGYSRAVAVALASLRRVRAPARRPRPARRDRVRVRRERLRRHDRLDRLRRVPAAGDPDRLRRARARRLRRPASVTASTSSSRGAGSKSSTRAEAAREPFLDIADQVLSGGEQGLLGLAFHPQYGKNRRFYVQYTDNNGETQVVEYRSNGTNAIPGSAASALPQQRPVRQPQRRHARLRPERPALLHDGRRRRRRRPREPLPEPTLAVRQAALDQRRHEGPARSRRSGSGTPGGSRSTARTAISTSATSARTRREEIDYTPAREHRARELRLGRLRGPVEVRGQAARPRQARPADRDVLARRRLLGHRRLRLPGLERSTARALHLR